MHVAALCAVLGLVTFFLTIREGRRVKAICRQRRITRDEYYAELGQQLDRRRAQAAH